MFMVILPGFNLKQPAVAKLMDWSPGIFME